ncbi:hypothetical protein Daus18300_003252 [Diaporthe australafricana]|uniref:TPR domain-containing protein n=1 Tax=Diaporthe australafricana TaxID=127596 RepID=A0ABR3XGV0_9PEZI
MYKRCINCTVSSMRRGSSGKVLSTGSSFETTHETMLLSIVSEIDDSTIEHAYNSRDLMEVYESTGKCNKAVQCARAVFDILTKESSTPKNDLANAYSDLGNSLCSAFKPLEALPYLGPAIEFAMLHVAGEPELYKTFNIDRFMRNQSRAHLQLGNFGSALEDLHKAELCQAIIHGPDSHYDGETNYERAKIAAWQGDLNEALTVGTKAYKLVRDEKPTHPSVSAALYRLGWVYQLVGHHDGALLLLERALKICQLNEDHRGNQGESARVKWRISQIYRELGREDEARKLCDEAEETKRVLLSTGDYAVVEDKDDKDASWDALVGLLYR